MQSKLTAFNIHLGALSLFVACRLLVHSEVFGPHFLASKKDHFRNSFLREASQPSEVLCFVLFHSGICLPCRTVCRVSTGKPASPENGGPRPPIPQTLSRELSMSVSFRTLSKPRCNRGTMQHEGFLQTEEESTSLPLLCPVLTLHRCRPAQGSGAPKQGLTKYSTERVALSPLDH